jgi:hypothetical protein
MRIRNLMTCLVAAAACVAAAGVTTTASAVNADPAPTRQYSAKAPNEQVKVLIRNVNSDKCVAVPGGSTALKKQLIQWPCGPFNPNDPANPYSPEKMWYLWQFSDGGVAFQNVKTGQCMTSAGSLSGAVWQYNCLFGNNQHWNYYITGSKRLWNFDSQDCMAVPNAQTGDGVGLIHWTCGNGDEQKWQISYLN